MSKITQNILWALGIIFVVMLVIPRNCSTGSNGVVSDTTRVTIYDTIKVIKPIAKDSVVVRYITTFKKPFSLESSVWERLWGVQPVGSFFQRSPLEMYQAKSLFIILACR